MVETLLTSAALDERRRRILFRSRRRGLQEMDVLLGRFADAHLKQLDERELSEFERILDVPDVDVLSWLTGREPVPDGFDTDFFRKLLLFHTHSGPLPL